MVSLVTSCFYVLSIEVVGVTKVRCVILRTVCSSKKKNFQCVKVKSRVFLHCAYYFPRLYICIYFLAFSFSINSSSTAYSL